ncbi:MAG: RNA-binding transcriptional accessory protein, partial [Clostridia bacterium]|nr:RNA-binding transcriptional accessory protein [Clostridia bacterium]
MDIITLLSTEFHIREQYVKNIIALLDEGCTIPFIARYRKEAHGTTDDQTLRALADRLEYLRNLDKRREEIRKSIDEQQKLTEELSAALDKAVTLAELEDLYRPYRPKRRTRATIAKEKGLEPLAELILAQDDQNGPPKRFAEPFVNAEKGVGSVEEALAGACDIIAEIISDDAELRRQLRAYCSAYAKLTSVGIKEEDSVYSLYYDHSEPLARIQNHRVLAVNRGEKEGFLKVGIQADSAVTVNVIRRKYLRGESLCSELLTATCRDAYDRLLFPSLERELRADLTERASEQAITVFASNLKQLLMQPPVRGKVTLGVDPAYRTGCKFAVVDATGKVLDKGVIYPTPPQNKVAEAKRIVAALIQRYGVTAVSIGNGTASKETEMFVSQLLRELGKPVSYMVVSEAGASVYSASKLAAEEFPDYDVSLRSAVSIARRLQDPLAELVKIDPKAIGVGQYQHDMPPARLDSALDGVVEDCVNNVGVDLNTASASLLAHVSGLSAAVAKNIVAYREENGVFTARTQLKKVPKLGPKAYEQCAGFLRIPGAKNILDNTGVHPE